MIYDNMHTVIFFKKNNDNWNFFYRLIKLNFVA